jgi:F-type H+-transporting ATPase subunit a
MRLTYWKSPTADVGVTLALSLMVSLVATLSSIKRFGFKGYIKHAFLNACCHVTNEHYGRIY